MQHVEGTSGLGVTVRQEPTTQSAQLGTIPEGSELDAECWVEGEPIEGNTLWEKTTQNGVEGFVSDLFLDTGDYPSGADLTARGIPQCNSGGIPQTEERTVNIYDGEAAASYAKTHAEDTPPYPASCTQLVSRAMWAAGVRQTLDWNDGEFNDQTITFAGRPGTAPAWRTTALVQFLLTEYPKTTERELDFSQNAVPDAKDGDVIAYDWNGDGEIDHLSMIVDKVSGDYPEVTEWSTAGGTEPTPYIERGWTWSQGKGEWLQQKYPHIRAELLRVDTSQIVKIAIGSTS